MNWIYLTYQEQGRIPGMDDQPRFRPTTRTTLHRVPSRGSYDRALAYSILDEGLYASVGFVCGDQPFALPMVYARDGGSIVLHGASASRALKMGASGVPLCVTVTLIDGLVLARSAFHHSMNYRSVVVLGRAIEVTDLEARRRALQCLVDHVLAGRSGVARPPNARELAATKVLSLPIDEASVKVRSGGPLDDDDDVGLDVWSGHLPLRLVALDPVPDARCPPRGPVPAHLLRYERLGSRNGNR
jgi:uncharacterized protein